MSFFLAENLSAHFDGIRAVEGVSFEVRQGEVYTIVGPNGAGKTTIFNLISRFYDPSSGSIFFNGKDLTALPPHQIAQTGIARTFQNIELFQHATVLQNLLVGRHTRRGSTLWQDLMFLPLTRRLEKQQRFKVEEVIDFLELQHYREQLISSLPYGVRKITELGRALCLQPQLLLLDEPSSGLSPEETDDISYRIEDIQNELGMTVIMVEHDMNLVSQVSNRVLAINEGQVIAEGTPEEVQQHPEVIRAYLGE